MTGASRILLADDSEAMRRILASVLGAAGFEVAAVEGVREALRLLRTFGPDIILTDFNMPGLNGEAFVRLLRRDPRFVGTPIFVVSSETASATRQRMEAAGADAWFGKPVDACALVRAIQSAGIFTELAGPRTGLPMRTRDAEVPGPQL